eukprot:31018-Pelagococcus_subviridis.AAC.23
MERARSPRAAAASSRAHASFASSSAMRRINAASLSLTPPPVAPPPRAPTPLLSAAISNTRSRSTSRSFASSIPVLIRTRSSGSPLAARVSAGMDACDMKHGNEMSELTPPKETVILNSLDSSTMIFDSSTSPVANDKMLPPPRACDACSACPALLSRPG